jgi:GNAT superfamily N-acetyltransferase
LTPARPQPDLTERLRDGYLLTCDPARVDVDRVHAWLSGQAYWAIGRERAVVEASIAGSRPYSVLAGELQAAFARVVTDGATFAWICDVFVDEPHRGRGIGTWLVQSILQDCEAAGVHRCVLGTSDAHEVYRSCGFTALQRPDRWMEIDLRAPRAAAVG